MAVLGNSKMTFISMCPINTGSNNKKKEEFWLNLTCFLKQCDPYKEVSLKNK